MINEFSIHAKPTNNKAKTAFTVCFFASFVLLFFANAIEKYVWVPQLLGMGLLVAAVVIYTKFLSSKYLYEIVKDTEGTPLFVVNQVIGRRMTTLCRIALYEIVKIEGEGVDARKSHKTPVGVKKYNYVPTFLPEKTFRIYTRGTHERAEIVVEVSDEVAEALLEYAREARELLEMREDDEEY